MFLHINRFKCFFYYQIANMAELLIRIITNLLVNELIAKLFDDSISNSIAFLRFKDNFHFIAHRMLMDVEAICKLVTCGNERFFRI